MAKVGFWLRGSRGKLAGASMGRGAKGETIVREIVTPKNPRTVAQCMQRMKIAPAQKFYNAFSEMLSNAFEGVQYGAESRRYFIGKIMRLEGPYIQKGVDRFIPAAYPFSEGSIPSVPIKAFNGGTNLIVLDLQSAEPGITPEILAEALNVTTDYQISVVVVNNNNGLFVPSYIGYEDRLTIAELPANTLTKQDGNIALHIQNLGLDNTNVVAACVVLSKQDASGKWLRSTQNMVISNELIASLYSIDALNAAIASYSSDAANTINSEWYYNLGIAQPYPGKLITANVEIEVGDVILGAQNAVIGVKQVNGSVRNTLFVDSLTNPTKQAMVVNGALKLNDIPQDIITAGVVTTFAANGYTTEEWKDIYAGQLGIYNTSGGGDTPASTLTINTLGGTPVTLVGVRNITGQYGSGAEAEPGNVVVAYDAEGNNYLIKNQNTEMWSYGAYLVHADKFENEQPESAWIGSVTTPAPTDNNTVKTEEPDDELATWLMNNGVSAKIFVHLP